MEDVPWQCLEQIYRDLIEPSEQFRPAFTIYKTDIQQGRTQPSYDRLRQMVDAHIEDKRVAKNLRHRKEQGGAMAATSTPRAPSQTKQGFCHQFAKYGSCSRTNCPYIHKADPDQSSGKGKGRGRGKGRPRSNSKGRGRGKGQGRKKHCFRTAQ